MRVASTSLLLLALALPAVAQAQQPSPARPNHVYFEVLGNGGLGSFNYERALSPVVAARVGIAAWTATDFWGGGDTKFLNVPLTLSFLPGGEGSGWEVGGGFLLGRATEDEPDYGLGGDPGSTTKGIVNLTAIVGYRWVRENGWISRIGFTPFLPLSGDYPDSGFFPSLGISFGKAF